MDNKTASWPILRRSRLKWRCFLPSSQQFKLEVCVVYCGRVISGTRQTNTSCLLCLHSIHQVVSNELKVGFQRNLASGKRSGSMR